ncbi:hypothetical protein NFI96_007642 [Prochilodus magdalenae]|nr:hypothetical protein NFI96_007642 [Prochilodus magdalenae]
MGISGGGDTEWVPEDSGYKHTEDTHSGYQQAVGTGTRRTHTVGTSRQWPLILEEKMDNMQVDKSMITWVLDYLSERHQYVRLGSCQSDRLVSSTGPPQGTVLSPFLFTLYTTDFQDRSDLCHLQNFSDDSMVVWCIRDGQDLVNSFVERSVRNHLLLNVTTTKEMVVDKKCEGGPVKPSEEQPWSPTDRERDVGAEETTPNQLTLSEPLREAATKSRLKIHHDLSWFYTALLGASNEATSEQKYKVGVSNKVASEWKHKVTMASEWKHKGGVSNKVASEWKHKGGVSNKAASGWKHKGGVSNKVASEWKHKAGVSNKVASEWKHKGGVSNKVASEWKHKGGVSNKAASGWKHKGGVSNKVASEWKHKAGVSNKVASEWKHKAGVSNKVASEWKHKGGVSNKVASE